MKVTWRIALVSVALAAMSAVETRAQPSGARAADCTACARSCKGRCEAQPGGCVCREDAPRRATVDDCDAACARSAGANASALEECRANCRVQTR